MFCIEAPCLQRNIRNLHIPSPRIVVQVNAAAARHHRQGPARFRPCTSTRQASSMTKYPSLQDIRQLFSLLESRKIPEFMSRVSKDVDWTVMGTSPMSERFRTLESFQNATLNRLGKCLQEPLRFEVKHIIGGGDQEWASVEMRAAPVKCKSGRDYDMTYAWQCRFDDQGMIVQVRAYIDTLLLTQVLHEHEAPSFHAPKDVY